MSSYAKCEMRIMWKRPLRSIINELQYNDSSNKNDACEASNSDILEINIMPIQLMLYMVENIR